MKVFISTYIHICSPFYLLKELTFYFTICEEKQHFLSKRFLYERINKMITSSSLYMFHLSIYLYNEGYFIIRIMGFIILIQIAWIHFLCAGNRIVDIYAKNWVILWTYCKYCIILINVLRWINTKYFTYMNKIIRYRWLFSFEYFSMLSVHFQSKYRWQEKVLGVNFLG